MTESELWSLTRPFSTRLVIMTMTLTFCSQIILQKSSVLDLRGPWAAMYDLVFLKSWRNTETLRQLLKTSHFCSSSLVKGAQKVFYCCTSKKLWRKPDQSVWLVSQVMRLGQWREKTQMTFGAFLLLVKVFATQSALTKTPGAQQHNYKKLLQPAKKPPVWIL